MTEIKVLIYLFFRVLSNLNHSCKKNSSHDIKVKKNIKLMCLNVSQDQEALCPFYAALIRWHLQYYILFWTPLFENDIDKFGMCPGEEQTK